MARVAVLRRFADDVSSEGSHLVEFVGNEVVRSSALPPEDLAMTLLLRHATDKATSLGLIARSSAPGDASDTWSCTVVDRAGPAATGFWRRDDTLQAAGEASGTIVDLLLRALDRPTLPCTQPTRIFWVADWLGRIALASSQGGGRLSLADLHVVSIGSGSPTLPTHRWADALLGQADRYNWHDLRLSIIDGDVVSPLMPPAVASWFDAGSLGRWCLCTGLFTADVESLFPTFLLPRAVQAVRDTLRHLRASNIGAPTPLDSTELLP